MMNPNLPAILKSAQRPTTARQSATALAPVSKAAVPVPVQQGIKRLLVASAGPALAQEDRGVVLANYVEAVVGFEQPLVERELAYLRLHNPRNPFPATAQDVYERLKEKRKDWLNRVTSYFIYDSDWHPDDGPPPGEDGCWIGPDKWLPLVREAIQEQRGYRHERVVEMSDSSFERIPANAFSRGEREKILRKREEWKRERERAEAERAAEAERERCLEELLAQQPEDVRAEYYTLRGWHNWRRYGFKSSEEVLEAAKQNVAERQKVGMSR